MKKSKVSSPIHEMSVIRINGCDMEDVGDVLSVEEPLEIRVTTVTGSESLTRPIAVTMRTPGEDEELAVGFLYTEGIISHFDQIQEIKQPGCNVVEVVLRDGVEVEATVFERHSFVASSCGVCGKRSIEAVKTRRNYKLDGAGDCVNADVIHALPDKLRARQKSFATTGGIHASGLFDLDGNLIMLKEDVGRHNALDKLLGACARQKQLPLTNHIILVSGRASFELIQKAAHAGTSILAAVGAPSSLAVQLAEDSGMTLLGFVRNNRFNVYSGAQRIAGRAPVLAQL